VEGIGNMQRGLMFTPGPLTTNGPWNELICFKQNNSWLYHNYNFNDCYPDSLNEIKETDVKNPGIGVFPDPVTNISYIRFDNTIRQYKELEIFNITGQKIKRTELIDQSSFTIYKNDFHKGIYFIRLTSKDGYSLKGKFIVE
jgi:hypothetical protein